MILESLLAFAHIAAILAMVVFVTSVAALCRPEWLNAKVVERLVRVNGIYGISAIAVLVTGLARTFWGVKGTGWYWGNGLLNLKLALFVAVAMLSIAPTRTFLAWVRQLRESGVLPDDADVRRCRRQVMVQAHLIALAPLAAVFLARGYGG